MIVRGKFIAIFVVCIGFMLASCASERLRPVTNKQPSTDHSSTGSKKSKRHHNLTPDEYQRTRYAIKEDYLHDSSRIENHQLKDAVPRKEPKSKGGNKSPYKVFGKRYYVMPSAKGYREQGLASWYGIKFHGHKTSNGETYDMYQMSAAHKSLPLPSYVRVTNLANNRSVIVRVNDRGPFHGDRLIDLSFAAATKLDFIDSGTARVNIEAIDVDNYHGSSNTTQPSIPNHQSSQANTWQLGAFKKKSAARNALKKLDALNLKAWIDAGKDGFYRLKIKLNQSQTMESFLSALNSLGFNNPIPHQ